MKYTKDNIIGIQFKVGSSLYDIEAHPQPNKVVVTWGGKPTTSSNSSVYIIEEALSRLNEKAWTAVEKPREVIINQYEIY